MKNNCDVCGEETILKTCIDCQSKKNKKSNKRKGGAIHGKKL